MVVPTPADRPWEVIVSTSRGAAHEVASAPLQDAAGFGGETGVPGGVVAAAVADGHGHRRHFRSDSGASLAITVGVGIARELATDFDGMTFDGHDPVAAVEGEARGGLVSQLVERWRTEVLRDLQAHPFDGGCEPQLHNDDDPVVAYGTTLLLALVTVRWLILCQIGDGDAVVVYEDGSVELPLPGDVRNDGWRTTSLCQHDAATAFRVAAVDRRTRPVAAVLLATDGVGNAQVDDPWQPGVARDLTRLARQHGTAWMRDQLPPWVARCASNEGSADDASVALLLASTTDATTVSAMEVGP